MLHESWCPSSPRTSALDVRLSALHFAHEAYRPQAAPPDDAGPEDALRRLEQRELDRKFMRDHLVLVCCLAAMVWGVVIVIDWLSR